MIRMPSRAVCIIASGIAALLLAAALIFQYINRNMQKDVETGAFEKQFTLAINSLNQAVTSVQRQIAGNTPGADQQVKTEPVQKPVINTVVDEREIVLQGISWTADVPIALVDGRIYQVGDVIGKFTLVRITTDTVFLEDKNGESKQIQLMEDPL